jgi:hypothetical protein
MSSDQFARVIAASLKRHQSRGLVDDAGGVADVVIHGRINLLPVADDVLAASAQLLKPARKSWGAWFICGVENRKNALRQKRKREDLSAQLKCGPTVVDVAITRLRMRDLDP